MPGWPDCSGDHMEKLHTHPKMEKDLGVDEGHVIIDKDVFEEISSNKSKLKEIVEQLESCNYQCEGGPFVMNVAFIELKKMAEGEN